MYMIYTKTTLKQHKYHKYNHRNNVQKKT